MHASPSDPSLAADASRAQRRLAILNALLLCGPVVAVLLLAVWRTPYGIGETIAILEDLETKSLGELTLGHGAYFRPGFWTMLWLIWQASPTAEIALALYKLLHVVTIGALTVGLLGILRPRSAADAVAAAAATAILIGSTGFRDNLENLPLNQMLFVMLCAAGAWLLIERRARASHQVLLPLLVIVALAFKEQGLVVAALVVTAWLTGAPGVTRRAAAAVCAIAVVYLGVRLLGAANWPTAAQSVGLGFSELSPAQVLERFGPLPLALYGYNAAATAANVLFAEPSRGEFRIVAALLRGEAAAWQWIQLASSLLATGLIGWWALTQARSPRERRAAVLLGVTLVGSAALGFNYTRDRFGGVAALAYAIAAYYGVRHLWQVTLTAPRWAAPALAVLLLFLAGGWQVRALGTIQMTREFAWSIRREWLVDVPERRLRFGDRPVYQQMIDALYPQGSDPFTADAPREPRWVKTVLGDW